MTTKQPNLFDVEPGPYGNAGAMSRRADPETSKQAAKTFKESGKLNAHLTIVLRVLRKNPASTFSELFAAANVIERGDLVDDKAVARRLPELEKMGLAKRMLDDSLEPMKRACRITGSTKQLWMAV